MRLSIHPHNVVGPVVLLIGWFSLWFLAIISDASADADRAAGLRPQPPAAFSQSSIPSAENN